MHFSPFQFTAEEAASRPHAAPWPWRTESLNWMHRNQQSEKLLD
jgi:hypothetical protein